MKHILDTHILLWYLSANRKLPTSHRKTIESAERKRARLGLSIATVWEVAKLHQYGKIKLPRPIEEFVQYLEEHPSFEILPLTGSIAIESTRLGEDFPRDPFDQIIVATARVHQLTLLTRDNRIVDSNATTCA